MFQPAPKCNRILRAFRDMVNARDCDFFEGELFMTDFEIDSIDAVNPNTSANTFACRAHPKFHRVSGEP